VDSEKEIRRLEAVYSNMAEGELRKIAGDAGSLTGEAVHALKAEIGCRGLDIPLTPAGVDVAELQEHVTVRKFRDLPEAVLAKGLLESVGIECFLADDNLIRLDWFISNFVGGVKLQVRPEDVEAANEILDQPIPDNFDVDGVGVYAQPQCLKCTSLDLTFEELNKPIAYASAWMNVPLPLHRKGWRCKSCGHQWIDNAPRDTEGV
jgi:Putative prokaryotic signal transducing protein